MRAACPTRRAVLRHAFRNSLIPIVTLVGLQFGAVLTGAVITETIFAWPGIGRLLIQSIGFRDYPLVQGCILLIALTYVGVNLLTDMLYGVLDPEDPVRMTRVGAAIVLVAVLAALVGPVLMPFDPARPGAGAAARRAQRPALVRPRRAGARHLRARALRRPHLAAGRAGGRWRLVHCRHAARFDRRLLRRGDRRGRQPR